MISDAEGAAWTTASDLAGWACALENGAVVTDGRRFRRADLDWILTAVNAGVPGVRQPAPGSSRRRRMTFWVDAQLPPKLCDWLLSVAGVEAVHVRDLGLLGAEDPERVPRRS